MIRFISILLLCLSAQAGRAVFPGYDAQVIDWNNRCNTNSGVTLPSTRLAATQFLRDVRVNNLFASIYRLNLFAGQNAPGTSFTTGTAGSCAPQIPLIITKGASLDSFQGSSAVPTYVEQGNNAGLQANTSASFFQRYDTGFNPTNDIANQNSFHLMVYVTRGTNEAGMALGAQGPAASTNSLYLMPGWVDAKFYCSQYNENQYAVTNAVTNGWFLGTRTGSTTLITYTNGVACATNNQAAGQPSTNSMYVFARHNGSGSVDNVSTKTLGGYSFGTGMTAADAAAYYTAWQRFETALGRQK